jgi:hypothetical protein
MVHVVIDYDFPWVENLSNQTIKFFFFNSVKLKQWKIKSKSFDWKFDKRNFNEVKIETFLQLIFHLKLFTKALFL